MTPDEPDPTSRDAVRQVYQDPGPTDRVLEAVRRHLHGDRATDPAVSVDDLAPVDAFHIRGREGTVALAELAGVEPGSRVLDVGSGLGGTARYLASRFDAEVVGVDLVPDYVGLARTFSEWTDLDRRTSFREGSAVDLPVSDGAFDVAWLEHVQMNVSDKSTLARELIRTLRPGGRLVLYEIFGTNRGDPHFPVPWADDASASFLVSAESFRDAVTSAGATVEAWEDVSEPSLEWFRGVLERVQREGPPPLGIHLLMGDSAPTKLKNVKRNLEEGRIRVIQGVFRTSAG